MCGSRSRGEQRFARVFKESSMSQVMTRLVGTLAALAISVPMIAGSGAPASADAGSAVAAGLLGGAVGVMVGAAAARPVPPPVVVYERPAPVEYIEPVCHMERQPVFDEDGNPAGSRRVRVCD
jgi:hypothetical protein